MADGLLLPGCGALGRVQLPDHGPRQAVEVPAADPVRVVAAGLSGFFACVALRRTRQADLHAGAVLPARLLDAARREAQEGRLVSPEEAG